MKLIVATATVRINTVVQLQCWESGTIRILYGTNPDHTTFDGHSPHIQNTSGLIFGGVHKEFHLL